jgi:uncharacterized protein YjbI with pentapeptide repeats
VRVYQRGDGGELVRRVHGQQGVHRQGHGAQRGLCQSHAVRRQLPGLPGANLSNANLTNANLTGADFTRCKLEGTMMAEVQGLNTAKTDNLRGAILSELPMTGFDLEGVDLSGASLCGTILNNANLVGAKLCDANITSANLAGANLTLANMANATVTDACLQKCKLEGAVLTNVQGPTSDMLRSAGSIRRVDLSGLPLLDDNLTGMDLAGANLAGANIAGARLSKANLTRTNLAGAKFINPIQLDGVIGLESFPKVGRHTEPPVSWVRWLYWPGG